MYQRLFEYYIPPQAALPPLSAISELEDAAGTFLHTGRILYTRWPSRIVPTGARTA